VSLTGLDAAQDSAFTHLFSPFASGCRVAQPHRLPAAFHRAWRPEWDADRRSGRLSRGARAAEFGLIVTESRSTQLANVRAVLNAWDPAIIPGLAKVAAGAHAHGAKIFAQLTHGGHTSLEHPPHIMWAPTQMPEPSSHFSTKALDDDDIRAVIDGFGVSAYNVVEAGFDGVEVKIAHDGLLRSFASPFFNHRTDAYGGSFENRMRLSFEVLEAIRKAIGAKPLGVRICLDEFTPFGYDLDYGLRMVRALEATGLVDYFNSDAGSFSSYWMEIPPAAVAPEAFDRLNRALKAATKLPVVAFGRITPPRRAEAMLKAGHADLIGWARQLIADPHTPNKLAMGRPDLVRPCIACNDGCIHQVGQEKGVRCIHNPAAGRELKINERLIGKADVARKIVVIGGGPAGLKVAEIAAKRGHKVTLLERRPHLGGQVLLAALQPEHAVVGEVVDHLEGQLAEARVDVRRGVVATPENVAELRPISLSSPPDRSRICRAARRWRQTSAQFRTTSSARDRGAGSIVRRLPGRSALGGSEACGQGCRHRRNGSLGGGGNRRIPRRLRLRRRGHRFPRRRRFGTGGWNAHAVSAPRGDQENKAQPQLRRQRNR
jgi:2,4-dienoyl-CoA reductase-like NADH-dependent reductase (Old Yellow Enzyme family)